MLEKFPLKKSVYCALAEPESEEWLTGPLEDLLALKKIFEKWKMWKSSQYPMVACWIPPNQTEVTEVKIITLWHSLIMFDENRTINEIEFVLKIKPYLWKLNPEVKLQVLTGRWLSNQRKIETKIVVFKNKFCLTLHSGLNLDSKMCTRICRGRRFYTVSEANAIFPQLI